MELRRVLFEYRLNQSAVARAATALGHKLWPSQVCATSNGKLRASPKERESIRVGLKAFGVPDDVIASIPELRPRARYANG